MILLIAIRILMQLYNNSVMATGLTFDVQIDNIKDYDLETTTGSTGTFAHFAQKAQRKKVQATLDSSK